jgi:hypothetical protein
MGNVRAATTADWSGRIVVWATERPEEREDGPNGEARRGRTTVHGIRRLSFQWA